MAAGSLQREGEKEEEPVERRSSCGHASSKTGKPVPEDE